MANHLHPLKRSKKKTLVGVEFERVGHKSGCVRDHAVGRRNRVALNSQISSHPQSLRSLEPRPTVASRAQALRPPIMSIGKLKRPNIGIARLKNQDRAGDGWSGE